MSFDLTPHFRFGSRKQRFPLAGRAVVGRVVQVLDLLPAARAHDNCYITLAEVSPHEQSGPLDQSRPLEP